MPTPSANINQSGVSGKYGRVFLFSSNGGGSLPGPVNFKRWSIEPQTESLDTTGFEDAGFHNGLTGIIKASITLEGPYQVNRTGGAPAPVGQLIVPGRLLAFQLYTIHPDYQVTSLGDLHRYTGIAQVLSVPHEQDVSQAGQNTFNLETRGRFYLPGDNTVPSIATLLAAYVGIIT